MFQHAPDRCRGEVEDERIHAGVEGAEEQRLKPPALVLGVDKPDHMGGVVGPKADGEDNQCAERQANGAQPAAPADLRESGQNEDEVGVTEGADEEGDAEENSEELQANRQQDPELLLGEIQVAGGWRRGVVAVRAVVSCCTFAPLDVGHDVDNGKVQRGHQPKHDACQHSVARPAAHGVPEGVGDPQVALDAHSGEEEGAVVDGDEEHEANEGAQGVVHQPGHVVRGLLHFEGQDDEKDEVRYGEVEEQDVDRRCPLAHLAAEGPAGQDVGGEAHQEGEDVEGKQQGTAHHGGRSLQDQILRLQEKNDKTLYHELQPH